MSLLYSALGQDEPPSDTLLSVDNRVKMDSTLLKEKKKNEITSPIKYGAKDSMMFSVKKKMIYSYGEATLGMDEMKLGAGHIKLNIDSNFLYAEAIKNEKGVLVGEPVFTEGDDKYQIKTIKYNFKTKKGIVTDVVTEQGGGFLHAHTTKMHPNKEIHISDGKFTTCDAGHPHFYMHLTKAKVIPDKKIISGPFYFVIADIPIPIGLPFGYFPNQKNRTSGFILPTFTEEKLRGFGLQRGGYYLALSDYVDITALGEVWTSGSWGIDFLSNYKKRYKYGGNLALSYKESVQSEKDLDDYSKISSFWVRMSYRRDTKANPTSTFSTNLNFGSTKHRKLESNNPNDFADNNTSSSIAYTKTWPGLPFNFSANMSGTQNLTTRQLNLELPTLTFNVNKQFPFKHKNRTGPKRWYEDINLSLSSNLKNSLNIADSMLFTQEAVKKMSNGMQYRVPVGTSFKVFKHLILSPNVSFNGRLYTNYLKQNPNEFQIVNGDTIGFATDTIQGIGHVYDFAFSSPLSTKLYGMVQFKKGRIAAIRHVMSPSIGFSYRPDFSEEKWGFYKKDLNDSTKVFSTYRNGVYGTAPPGKSGSVSFSVDNNFEMKTHSKDTTEKFKKIVLLQSLRFGTSYNIAADSLKWSDVNISANTKLFKQIDVSYNGAVDLYMVDSAGRSINKMYIKEKGRIGNLFRNSISLSGSIGSDTFKKKKENEQDEEFVPETNAGMVDEFLMDDDMMALKKMGNEEEGEEETSEETDDYAFSMPWNVSINYNFNNNKAFNAVNQKFESTNTQTLSLNSTLSLTKNWKIGGSASFDLEAKKLVHTSWNIYRNLHCWEMSFNFVPFGSYQSYSFKINVKSSLFQGLEYKKQANWRDNATF